MYCKQGLCMTKTNNGYCDEHGGRERQEREWAAQIARAEKQIKAQGQKPKGQAVPLGQGLSQFTSEATREARREAKRQKRAKKEAIRKALRAAHGPKKPKKKNDGADKDKRRAAKNANK